MQDRDYHHRKAIRSNSSYHWQMFKKLRKRSNNKFKLLKSRYFTDVIERFKGNATEMWKTLKQIFPPKSSSEGPRPCCRMALLPSQQISLIVSTNSLPTSDVNLPPVWRQRPVPLLVQTIHRPNVHLSLWVTLKKVLSGNSFRIWRPIKLLDWTE